MPTIHFSAPLIKIGSWTILRLPKSVSAKLPSRGIAMIEGTMNGFTFQTEVEPDGVGSHWFKLSEVMQKQAKVAKGDTVEVEISPTKEWPEPNVPKDLQDALESSSQAKILWKDITPMARWDWIRWIRSTKKEETRKRRIDVMLSKLKKGSRRPCCFNRTECTVPEVSNKGVLLGSA